VNGQTQRKRDTRALGLRTDFHETPAIFRHENYFARPWGAAPRAVRVRQLLEITRHRVKAVQHRGP
jgi:hypothetical protein